MRYIIALAVLATTALAQVEQKYAGGFKYSLSYDQPAFSFENYHSTSVTGNARGAGAVDLQYGRNNGAMVASGRSSFIGGGTNNTASGIASAVVGGSGNTASGDYSAILGGVGNSVAAYGLVAGDNSAGSATGAVVIGSYCTSSGQFSFTSGRASKSPLYGQSSRASGYFINYGDAQMSILTARYLMTIATSTVTNLYLDGVDDKLVIPASSTWGMRVEIVGRANTGESGYYVINALVERDAANDATIVGQTAAPVMWEDDGAWDVVLAEDDTAGAITVTVTGNNETTIRWVATVYLTQVGG